MRDPFRRRQITHHGLASEGIGLKCSGKWSNSLIAIHLSALLFLGGAFSLSAASAPDSADACFRQLAEKPEFTNIKEKIPLGILENPKFAMLINEKRIDPKDKPIFAKWVNGFEECFALSENDRQNAPKGLKDALEKFKLGVGDSSLLLYKGNMTYGDYAKRRKDLISSLSESIAILSSLRKSEAQAAEAARADAAARAAENARAAAAVRARDDADREARVRVAKCQNARSMVGQFCRPEIFNSSDFSLWGECTIWQDEAKKLCL